MSEYVCTCACACARFCVTDCVRLTACKPYTTGVHVRLCSSLTRQILCVHRPTPLPTTHHHQFPDPPESSLKLTSTTTDSTNAVQHGKASLEKLSPFLKATLLQTLFIFIQALSFVGFYREGDWWAIVKRLLLDAFYLPHLAVDFRDFFAWPDFSLPTLEFKLTLAVSFVGIAVVAPYFRAVLSWCHSQSWFATGAGKPGRWEGRIMAVFAGLR